MPMGSSGYAMQTGMGGDPFRLPFSPIENGPLPHWVASAVGRDQDCGQVRVVRAQHVAKDQPVVYKPCDMQRVEPLPVRADMPHERRETVLPAVVGA
jgi:hypothetical protein